MPCNRVQRRLGADLCLVRVGARVHLRLRLSLLFVQFFNGCGAERAID